MWFQRSRSMWLADGDRNTKYYHLQTVNRRRKNKILMLKDEGGNWIEDKNDIKKYVTCFHQNLFTIGENWKCWNKTKISYPSIPNDDLLKLGEKVSKDEVRKAVFNMKPWKAPGPDGFSAGFYQKSWDVVGSSVCDFAINMW